MSRQTQKVTSPKIVFTSGRKTYISGPGNNKRQNNDPKIDLLRFYSALVCVRDIPVILTNDLFFLNLSCLTYKKKKGLK